VLHKRQLVLGGATPVLDKFGIEVRYNCSSSSARMPRITYRMSLRHLFVLLALRGASGQIRMQYPFGAGPIIVQCPSGDITVTCGEASAGAGSAPAAAAAVTAPAAVAAPDAAMAELRQQMLEMSQAMTRMSEERKQLLTEVEKAKAGAAPVQAAVDAYGSTPPLPPPQAAPMQTGAPLSTAESALLTRLEITQAQLYSETQLDFSSRQLDDSDCKTLAELLSARGATGMVRLQELWLSENLIGDAGLTLVMAALTAGGALPSLTKLFLTNNQIGADGARAVADALGLAALTARDGLRLQELGLSENQMGDDGLRALAAAVGRAPLAQLEELWLTDNRVGDAGARALADCLSAGALPRLRNLFLNHNQIGGGAAALGRAWAAAPPRHLEQLDLSYNQLDDEAAAQLADGLRTSGAMYELQHLWLGSNALSDAAVVALAKALEGGAPKLHELNLQWNSIANDGASALAKAIGGGAVSNLQYLYLDNNQIGDDGAVSLADSLRSKVAPVLKELHIWSNHIGDVGRTAFENALAAQGD